MKTIYAKIDIVSDTLFTASTKHFPLPIMVEGSSEAKAKKNLRTILKKLILENEEIAEYADFRISYKQGAALPEIPRDEIPLHEIFVRPDFLKIVDQKIDRRLKRLPAPVGKKYIRNGLDLLIDLDEFNASTLCIEFDKIINKKSQRSRSIRDSIYTFIAECLEVFVKAGK